MPTGALAVPLSFVEQLAGIYKEFPVRQLRKKAAVIFAADHGVVAEGVSAYPQEVTQQMLGSFANGWAVITVLCKNQNIDVRVVDVGVKGSPVKGIINKKIAEGTKNFAKGAAMTKKQALAAIAIGREQAAVLAKKKYDIAIVGEMGIVNTTATSAIASCMLGVAAVEVTDRGTGINDKVYQKKVAVIEKALKLHGPNKKDAIEVLCCVGGFEIAAMVGFILGCGEYRIPVVLDGVITAAAALLAHSITPLSMQYCIAGHVGKEKAHEKILQALGLTPLLNLGLRLGEGSGAALALPLLEQAIVVSNNTGTFSSAHVSNKE
jgi:nicotinate-nucleotide--dimethylbenzimidazole phosphoribosyltransferase